LLFLNFISFAQEEDVIKKGSYFGPSLGYRFSRKRTETETYFEYLTGITSSYSCENKTSNVKNIAALLNFGVDYNITKIVNVGFKYNLVRGY
jgi:hypothetical protein